MQLKILAVDLEMTTCSQSRTVKSFAKRQANNFLGAFKYKLEIWYLMSF